MYGSVDVKNESEEFAPVLLGEFVILAVFLECALLKASVALRVMRRKQRISESQIVEDRIRKRNHPIWTKRVRKMRRLRMG